MITQDPPARGPAPAPPRAMRPFLRVQHHHGPSTVPLPRQVPGLVRGLVPFDDDARSPVVALLSFDLTSPAIISIVSTSATSEGINVLAEAGYEYVAPGARVVVAVRASALTGPEAELDAAPDRGLAAARPGWGDVEVLVAARDTLCPLINGEWEDVQGWGARHLDTQLVTERNAWSVNCQSTCPGCPIPLGGPYASDAGLACWPETRTDTGASR